MSNKTRPKPKTKAENEADYFVVFNSPEGQRVLEDLKKRFADRDLQGRSVDETMINVGGHKLIQYIILRMTHAPD